jgi:DNA repair protein RecN (Recombination protein N)
MALRHLHLRDFVIVPALELSLAAGFTALTGETGAGKSILIDALQLVLGDRGDALWVREGQPRCEIGAEFDTPPDARAWLLESGFVEPHADADTVLLRRTIDAAGRSRAWINGSPATLAQLRELGQRLVDIHGQHAWQSLTRPAAVRALLDAYAGLDTRPLATAWQAWRQAEAALNAARAAQDNLAQEHQRLSWQIAELDKLAPLDGEWDEINQRHARLSHAQALIDGAQAASAALEGDDRDGGALPALARAQQALEQQRGIEPEFAALLDVLEGCVAQARDVVHSLHTYLRRAEPNPDQLAALDERLGQWIALARRYRRQPQDLFATLTEWRAELARLDSATDLASLEATVETTHTQYLKAAQAVSRQRAQAAPRLAASVTAAMQKLGMPGRRFEVALDALPEAAQHGLESVTFQVAAHAGSAPRAIERVASGGELSRLALAIAVTTSELGSVETLVFDEVDSGVGGAVAATVGRMLHQLGRDRQVLCVTHLPQVAACADSHLLVTKRTGDDGAPVSDLEAVSGEARTREVARMLGGERISDTTLAHALEMLRPAEPPADTAAPVRAPRKARS